MDQSFFTLANDVNPSSYKITARECLDHKDIHRVFFKIQVNHVSSQQDLMAIAQKIVKELIQQEECHSISIDFGTFGHADFAPQGSWNKAGEVPINNYEDYRFKYMLTSGGT